MLLHLSSSPMSKTSRLQRNHNHRSTASDLQPHTITSFPFHLPLPISHSFPPRHPRNWWSEGSQRHYRNCAAPFPLPFALVSIKNGQIHLFSCFSSVALAFFLGAMPSPSLFVTNMTEEFILLRGFLFLFKIHHFCYTSDYVGYILYIYLLYCFVASHVVLLLISLLLLKIV